MSPSLVAACSVSSPLSFSALQAVYSKLASFVANVLLSFNASIFVSLIHFQPPLSISSDDTHHILIGTFLPPASTVSDVQNSHTSHFGVCMPFLHLTAATEL